eukprot:GHVN01104008.1.p1 GENE.GHVN01104008.1~~GHVN01104008.1.p1  ORF type:complete len:563 (-),score=112.39 GHVN01104008.1:306-1994(-)
MEEVRLDDGGVPMGLTSLDSLLISYHSTVDTLTMTERRDELKMITELSHSTLTSLKHEREAIKKKNTQLSETISKLSNDSQEVATLLKASVIQSEAAEISAKESIHKLKMELAYLKEASEKETNKKGSLIMGIKRVETEVESDKVKLTDVTRSQEVSQWRHVARLQLVHQLKQAHHQLEAYQLRLLDESGVIEGVRKRLHNTVQELKGNIRVFCRIRPRMDREKSDGLEESRVEVSQDRMGMVIRTRNKKSVTGLMEVSEAYRYNFDRVFPSLSSQKDVFDEVSQLVQCALDGYNVAIFAYGQTGSGKTFTMEGPPPQSDVDLPSLGVIPRAVDLIFSEITKLKSKGWNYRVETSFLEIYNETVRDLLTDSITHSPDLDVKVDAKGAVYVANLKTVQVEDSGTIHHLMSIAARSRSFASTECNERSSRSHSVFQLKIIGDNSKLGVTLCGVLSLVDLAGSERVEKSKVEGDRFKETLSINKSLSCLGDVIAALATKSEHVPFRNSKLTMLMKDSLGGNAKTLMFVNLSPLELHFSETLNSLRFASKVNNCSMGTAKRTVQTE